MGNDVTGSVPLQKYTGKAIRFVIDTDKDAYRDGEHVTGKFLVKLITFSKLIFY